MRRYELEAGFAMALLFIPVTASQAGVDAAQVPLLGSPVTLWVALPTRSPPPHCSCKGPHHAHLRAACIHWCFIGLSMGSMDSPRAHHPPRSLLWGPGWELSASRCLLLRHAITGPQPLGSGCHLERETQFAQGLFGPGFPARAHPCQAQASSPEEGLRAPGSAYPPQAEVRP